MHLRTTWPPTRCNDDIELTATQWDIMLKHQHRFLDRIHRDDTIPTQLYDECRSFRVDFLGQAFVYVATETMMDYPYVYVTEKTWKPVLASVPFMIMGVHGTLAWLRNQGFRTFDRWWDESYDSLPRAADRVQAVCDQLQQLARLSQTELERMRQDMTEVLRHNLTNLRDMRSRDLANIQSML